MVVWGITALLGSLGFLIYAIYDYRTECYSYHLAGGMSALLMICGVFVLVCNGIISDSRERLAENLANLPKVQVEEVRVSPESESLGQNVQYNNCTFYSDCDFAAEEKEDASAVDEKEFDLVISKDGIEIHKKKSKAR